MKFVGKENSSDIWQSPGGGSSIEIFVIYKGQRITGGARLREGFEPAILLFQYFKTHVATTLGYLFILQMLVISWRPLPPADTKYRRIRGRIIGQ
jgi:hypothetical protein